MAASGGLDVPGKTGRMAAGKAEEEEEEDDEKIRRKGFGSESQTRILRTVAVFGHVRIYACAGRPFRRFFVRESLQYVCGGY
jgi:hypothetical protein